MKKLLVNYGGILFFYLIVVFGVLSLCSNNTMNKPKSSGLTTFSTLTRRVK